MLGMTVKLKDGRRGVVAGTISNAAGEFVTVNGSHNGKAFYERLKRDDVSIVAAEQELSLKTKNELLGNPPNADSE